MDIAFLMTHASLRPRSIHLSRCLLHAPPSVPNQLPISSAVKAFVWQSSTSATGEFAGRGGKCAVLWLRVGDLRLADNPAVHYCARFDGAVLPVLTVTRHEIGDALIGAVRELRRRFEDMGSALFVRLDGGQETSVVKEVAATVGAQSVVFNWGRDVKWREIAQLREHGIRVQMCGQYSAIRSYDPKELSERPYSFPETPRTASQVHSDLCLGCGGVEGGESVARIKLQRLIRQCNGESRNCDEILRLEQLLSDELHLGCLSRARVAYEFEQRRRIYLQRKSSRLSSLGAFFARFRANPAIAALSIAAYDVNGGDRRGVEWDEETNSFQLKEWEHTEKERLMTVKERWQEFWRRRRLFFIRSFFPDDVTPDYYSFTAWRFSQRCVSATIGVFGTSSLLFALGIRSGRIGQAAVISWVLKDGLGRVGKMIWAGSMGKDFDVDPKRWRFRSALLYAMGNGLEIVTQIFPASFLIFATLANSMKQVSMLTASATRNAMYRSFGDRSQNIANITAKGEAQIVVADLIGMGCGIRLSKVLGSSRQNMLAAYCALTALDMFGIYMELRQVVFRTLNAERSSILVNHFIRTGQMLSPSDVSPNERIMLTPRYKSEVRLSSISKAARDPQELELLLRLFRREYFLVGTPKPGRANQCRLVLRKDASNEDVLRALLLVGYVREGMKNLNENTFLTTEDQEQILQTAIRSAKKNFGTFVEAAKSAGWSTDNLLFSTLKRRGYWGKERDES